MTNTNNTLDLTGIQVLLFDLDDTLYPRTNGVWEQIGRRIERFLIEVMGFPAAEVPELRRRLWQQYGTTLRGLQAEYAVDMDAYLAYVHDVPLADLMPPDPALARALATLPQPKFLFTNSDLAHTRRVTDQLGVTAQFMGVVDIYAMFPHCKPEPEAFHKALQICKGAPTECLLIDDSPRNLETARALGMKTVSIGQFRHDGSPHFNDIRDCLATFKGDFG